MGRLSIHGVTVSVDFGDKVYGQGNGRFMSASSKIPEGSEGIPIDEADEAVRDGIDLYFTAWQTLMQTRYASGEITAAEYKQQTASFLVRIKKIAAIYEQLKDVPTEELEAYLQRKNEEK
jgi:hypothetical protein